MNLVFLLFLGTLCTLGLTYQVQGKSPLPSNAPLKPGDLLRNLDAITSDAQVIYSPLQETPPPKADRRVYHDDESPTDHHDSASDYDYDKAYENFVNKYFAKGEEELDSSDDHEDDDVESEKSIDTDDIAAPFEFSSETDEQNEKRSSSNSKNCEEVTFDNETCKICEDPESNEKSKTCSYSSNNKPKNYGYSKQRSRKHSSDGADNDDDDDDGETNTKTRKYFKRETSTKRFHPRRTSIAPLLKTSTDESSKCTRKLEDGLICFYCGSVSENTRECMVDKNNLKKHRLDEASKKDTQTKRIFKRMVSYSFKNNNEPKYEEKTHSVFKSF